MTSEREKLMEMLEAAHKSCCVPTFFSMAEVYELIFMQMAEYLTANGVIVPPCKVGQTVYVINSLWVSEYTVKEIAYDDIFMRFYCSNEEYAIECRNFMFFDERIGKTVFLSREDAEKALNANTPTDTPTSNQSYTNLIPTEKGR